MQAAVAVLLLSLLVAAIASSYMRELATDDVKIAASDLRSAASTTRQLIEQYQRGEVTERFYRAHVQLLDDEVSSQYDSLNTVSVEETIRGEHASVRDLASALDNMLQRLEDGRANLDESRKDALQMTRQLATLEEIAAVRSQAE